MPILSCNIKKSGRCQPDSNSRITPWSGNRRTPVSAGIGDAHRRKNKFSLVVSGSRLRVFQASRRYGEDAAVNDIPEEPTVRGPLHGFEVVVNVAYRAHQGDFILIRMIINFFRL